MIVAGNPEEGLLPHQLEAHEIAMREIEKNGKAAVIMPTGCGKSFVALQMIQDNKDKDVLFVAPSNVIENQMYQYIAKYIVGEEPTKERSAKEITEENFPNFKITLYQGLKGLNHREMKQAKDAREKINPELIILDELHRAGAETWLPEVKTLLERCPNAKLLGLTATPERSDGKDMVKELFDGKKAYDLSLIDAFAKGILKEPKYIVSQTAKIEWLEENVKNIKNPQRRRHAEELLEKFKQQEKSNTKDIINEHIEKKDGKYVVFCKDYEHMLEMQEKSKEWFGDIDDNPEIYTVYSGEKGEEKFTDKKNEQTIEAFKKSNSEHLKLLFSIRMLDEGLHAGDTSGEIFLNPTKSKIRFLQQLGRVLSASGEGTIPVVLDMVNNITQYLESVEAISRRRKELGIEKDKDSKNDEYGLEILGKEPEVLELIDIFNQDKKEQNKSKEYRDNYKYIVTILKEEIGSIRDKYSKIEKMTNEMKEEKKKEVEVVKQEIQKLIKDCTDEKELKELKGLMQTLNATDKNSGLRSLYMGFGGKTKRVNKMTEKEEIKIYEEDVDETRNELTELEQKKDELQKQKNIEIKIGEMEKLIDIQRSNDDQGRAEV